MVGLQTLTRGAVPFRAMSIRHATSSGGEAEPVARLRLPLLGLGLALLLGAWLMATQPFNAPDEASHYLRALTIANGHVIGPKIPYAPAPPLTRAQFAWINRDTRGVVVPARLSPPNVKCVDGKRDVSGSCMEAIANGNFPPYAYLLPALALKASNHTLPALWWTRVASALPALAFLLLAAALLWSGTGWSLIGLLAAITPMVLFASSVMNSSGVEITACLAFAASVLRVTRRPSRTPTWVWAAFAITGAVAMVSWPLGLVFVLADLGLFAALLGREGLRELMQTSRRPLAVCMSALAAAGVLWLIYSRAAGLGADKVGISPLWRSLDQGISQLPEVLRQAVGTFGLLTVHLPLGAYWIWWVAILALLAAALWLGGRRDRWITATVTLLALAFPVFFYAWFDRFTGFDVQGREVLPLLVLIPLVAGEVVHRRRAAIASHRAARLTLGGAVVGVGAFQAYAWWFNARAMAGGPHRIRFFDHAVWSPPGTWTPWIVLAGLGALAVAANGYWLTVPRSRVIEAGATSRAPAQT
jgi:hypothetical protein